MAILSKESTHVDKLEDQMESKNDDAFMVGKINTILVEYIPDIAINVKVTVKDGVATLEGVAKDYVGKDAITEHVGNLTGIKGVINNMIIENSLSAENSFNRNRKDIYE
jgi:osmotically-inducible protein OsmY